MPLSSTNYGLALRFICTTDTQRKTEFHLSIESCRRLWHTQGAEHCTPTSHMEQVGDFQEVTDDCHVETYFSHAIRQHLLPRMAGMLVPMCSGNYS